MTELIVVSTQEKLQPLFKEVNLYSVGTFTGRGKDRAHG